VSVCSYVVGTNETLVVEDLCADHRFRDNPVVRSTGARFYAGAPLRSDSGRAIGSVCIVDTQPRSISERERELLGLLAGGVMARVKLQVASRKLLNRTLQIDRDLEQAARMQQLLLPPARIEGDEWSIEHLYRPVERLCGDFVDVSCRPDGSLAILVADITGHGTAAALTAAMTKTAFLRSAPRVATPAALLNAIHADLTGAASPDQFITAIAALFDPATMSIELASAGHPNPFLVTGEGVEIIDPDSDMALLIESNAVCRSHRRLALSRGDRLLIYTDGAIEASGGAGELLGMSGLVRMAGQTAGDHDGAFLDSLFARIRGYAGGHLQDDVALLTVTAN
jgi:serine phosphatase RsbU (regulator of sigma subunit)